MCHSRPMSGKTKHKKRFNRYRKQKITNQSLTIVEINSTQNTKLQTSCIICNAKIKIMTAQDLRYPGGGKFSSRFAFTV